MLSPNFSKAHTTQTLAMNPRVVCCCKKEPSVVRVQKVSPTTKLFMYLYYVKCTVCDKRTKIRLNREEAMSLWNEERTIENKALYLGKKETI